MAKLARNERLIHSFKTAMACCIGFLVAYVMKMQVVTWVAITICVIMCAQVYSGDILQKSWLRFVGTILGCLFASVVMVTFGVSIVSILVTIVVAGFIFTYIATGPESISYAGTLGAITTMIVIADKHPSLKVAGDRLLEISLGIVIAAVVSRLILPIRARDHIIRSQSATLAQLRRYYINTVVTNTHTLASTELYELDEEIGVAISAQRQTAKAASTGWFEPAFDRHAWLQSISSEKEILRSINFMHIAMTEIRSFEGFDAKHPSIGRFNDTIIHSLDILIAWIGTKGGTGTDIPALTADFAVLRRDMLEAANGRSSREQSHVEAFLFSAEILAGNVAKLLAFYERDAAGTA